MQCSAVHGDGIWTIASFEVCSIWAQVPPEVSEELLKQLEEMGFPANRWAGTGGRNRAASQALMHACAGPTSHVPFGGTATQ